MEGQPGNEARIAKDVNDASELYVGQVQLAVDASQPAPEKKLLRLHVPILAFFAYVARTMDVMYGSTLMARTGEEVIDHAQLRMSNVPDKWGLEGWEKALDAML